MKSMSKSAKIILWIAIALMLIALGCWIAQQVVGLGLTGMSNGTSWGLYICCFLFFVGLSAGGLIVASAGNVFHIKDYEKIALPAVILSLSSILVAGALILIDLGGIARLWRLFTGPNFSSPLVWDVCVITTYIVLNILELVFLVSKKDGAARKSWIVSCIALPVAILVHSVTAWILGLQIGREWYSSIMAPLFVVSAIDSGLGLLILSLFGLKKVGSFKTPKRIISKLALLLAVVCILDFYMIGCELLTSAYPADAHVMQYLGVLLTGPCAPAFWIEMILLIAAFIMLASKKRRQNMKVVGWASAMVVVSVFCKRVWLLFSGFVYPNIEYGPGIMGGSLTARLSTGDQVWAVMSNYMPSIPEVLIALGVAAFGVFMYVILSHNLIPKFKAAHPQEIESLNAELKEEGASVMQDSSSDVAEPVSASTEAKAKA